MRFIAPFLLLAVLATMLLGLGSCSGNDSDDDSGDGRSEDSDDEDSNDDEDEDDGDGRVGQTVTVFELEEGDCFDSGGAETLVELELIDCDGPHDFEVIELFDVPDAGEFPGEAYFDDVANDDCPADTATYVSPNAETWDEGDREVICLAAG